MSTSKKLPIVAGATALVFGSAFGLTTESAAREKIVQEETFKGKLEAIRAAVESGQIRPFTVTEGKWTYNESEKVDLMAWQQTWEKIDWNKKA